MSNMKCAWVQDTCQLVNIIKVVNVNGRPAASEF